MNMGRKSLTNSMPITKRKVASSNPKKVKFDNLQILGHEKREKVS